MSVEDVMAEHGFRLSASCAGKAYFTKFIRHEGKSAYVAVTDATGEGFPSTLEEPVKVTVYDMRSGDEIGDAREISSLAAYLESMRE